MGMKGANYPMAQPTGRMRDRLPIFLKQSKASTALRTVRQANQFKHPRTVNDNPTDLPIVFGLTHGDPQKLLQVALSHSMWVSPFHHVPRRSTWAKKDSVLQREMHDDDAGAGRAVLTARPAPSSTRSPQIEKRKPEINLSSPQTPYPWSPARPDPCTH